MLKRFFCFIFILFMTNPGFSKTISGDWHNDLRTLFLKNNAIIYTINMRTFNAKDTNKNELIDGSEESGNFINAIERLDSLLNMGINTLHVLPINKIGKVKAHGTAGSLYALTSFTEINPQLISNKSSLSPIAQAKRFVKECHNRNIRVIIDLPSCGGYDMYLESPNLFVKDNDNNPIIPLDWSDVRILSPNDDLLNAHKQFIDMAINIGFDGIRADVARLKPKAFWEELIKYAREKDPEFLFLAEASEKWTEPISNKAPNTGVIELLDAGFDGYLGSYFTLKNISSGKDLISLVEKDLKTFKKYNNEKSVIGSFSTHDEVSPIQISGANFSKMIIWLNSTLPLNSYYVDGFDSGDTYIYPWANKYAKSSKTDDGYYFIHNGKIDIFNFSRRPGGDDYTIQEEFILANKFKNYYATALSGAKFVPLKTSNPKIFSYARVLNNGTIVVIGNLDFNHDRQVTVKVPKFKPDKYKITNLRVHRTVKNEYLKGKIKSFMNPGDIQVLLIKNLVF